MTVKEFVEMLKDFPLSFSLYDNDMFGFEMIIEHPLHIELVGTDLPVMEGSEDCPLTMTIGEVLARLQSITNDDRTIVASSDYCEFIHIEDVTLRSDHVSVHLERFTVDEDDDTND